MRRERENRERRLKKGEEEARKRNSHYRKNPKRSGTKLKDLLCSANSTKHDPVLKPGVYEFQCPCSDKAK